MTSCFLLLYKLRDNRVVFAILANLSVLDTPSVFLLSADFSAFWSLFLGGSYISPKTKSENFGLRRYPCFYWVKTRLVRKTPRFRTSFRLGFSRCRVGQNRCRNYYDSRQKCASTRLGHKFDSPQLPLCAYK